MNTTIKNIARSYACILAMIISISLPAMARAAAADPMNPANPQEAMLAAEERFKQAEKEFIAAENAEARAALAANGNATIPAQRESGFTAPATGATMQPQRQPAPQGRQGATAQRPANTQAKPAEPARQDVQINAGPNFVGTPQTGYSSIWSDPATGDNNISVIAPSEPVLTTPTYPMVIEPIVGGGSNWSGDYGSSGSSWSDHWPGYQPPPFSNGMYPPLGSMHGHRPPWNHNYRPLRPNNPSIWNPGEKPNPGMPPFAGGNPNWGPGQSWNPAPNPGWNPGPNPGWNPGPNPGWAPGPNPNNPAIQPPLPGMPGSPNGGNPAIQPPLPGMPGSPPAQPGMGPVMPPQGMNPGPFPPGYLPGIPGGGMPANMRPLPMYPGGWHGRPSMGAPMGRMPQGRF